MELVAILSLEGSSISVVEAVLGQLHCAGTLAVVWCMASKTYMLIYKIMIRDTGHGGCLGLIYI